MYPHWMNRERTAGLNFRGTCSVSKDPGEALSGVPIAWHQSGQGRFPTVVSSDRRRRNRYYCTDNVQRTA